MTWIRAFFDMMKEHPTALVAAVLLVLLWLERRRANERDAEHLTALSQLHAEASKSRDALHEKRINDRDAMAREVLGYIERNTSASLALQRTVDDLRSRRRSTSSPSLPVVAPPVPRVVSVQKEDTGG